MLLLNNLIYKSMKKFSLKLVIRICIAVAFVCGYVYLEWKWGFLFLYAGLLSLVAILNLILKYRLYCRICDDLELVGDNIPRRANHLYIKKNIKNYLRFAPWKEVKKFIDCRTKMQKDDLFYGEVNLVVKTIEEQ